MNQDSLTVKRIHTPQGEMVLAALFDGMGGLAKGEVASAELVRAFHTWAYTELPGLCDGELTDQLLRRQWEALVEQENERIKEYGRHCGVRLGTTAVVMLLTQTRYYLLNVGDSRAYEIITGAKQLTNDHTLVAREIATGCLTPEEAETDPRRSVLLQCIGASDKVYPDMFFGDVRPDAVYMLCSDGFRHLITLKEIFDFFQPKALDEEETMYSSGAQLIELNKQRGERDNISVVLVKTY